jgi:hypothetical protein
VPAAQMGAGIWGFGDLGMPAPCAGFAWYLSGSNLSGMGMLRKWASVLGSDDLRAVLNAGESAADLSNFVKIQYNLQPHRD